MTADPTAARHTGVPDDTARQLYLAILGGGGRIPVADVADSDGPALRQLIDIGLIALHAMDASYSAISPRAVSDRLGSELRSEATRLLVRAEGLPDDLDTLTRAYDALPRHTDQSEGAVHVEGRPAIRHRIAQLLSDCKDELLTAQPGPRQESIMALALRQDLPLLAGGRTMRALYQPVAAAQPAVIGYAVEVERRGAKVKVLDEPFQRAIIIDRSVAVIPAADDHTRAAFVSDPAAVAYLVAGYERDWARAETVDWDGATGRQSTRRAGDRVGRLLATGLTQRAVATRLNLSERTVAGHISRLRERHGAQTLFQLGWLMRGDRDD